MKNIILSRIKTTKIVEKMICIIIILYLFGKLEILCNCSEVGNIFMVGALVILVFVIFNLKKFDVNFNISKLQKDDSRIFAYRIVDKNNEKYMIGISDILEYAKKKYGEGVLYLSKEYITSNGSCMKQFKYAVKKKTYNIKVQSFYRNEVDLIRLIKNMSIGNSYKRDVKNHGIYLMKNIYNGEKLYLGRVENYFEFIELLKSFNIDKVFIEKHIENKINPFMNIRGIIPVYLNNKRTYICIDDMKTINKENVEKDEISCTISTNIMRKHNIYKYSKEIIKLLNEKNLDIEEIKKNIRDENEREILINLFETQMKNL